MKFNTYLRAGHVSLAGIPKMLGLIHSWTLIIYAQFSSVYAHGLRQFPFRISICDTGVRIFHSFCIFHAFIIYVLTAWTWSGIPDRHLYKLLFHTPPFRPTVLHPLCHTHTRNGKVLLRFWCFKQFLIWKENVWFTLCNKEKRTVSQEVQATKLWPHLNRI